MTIKLDGFADLHKALGELGKSTERGVLNRVGKAALEPMLQRVHELVPVDSGMTRDSIVIGTRLSGRAKRAERREPKNGVRVYVGTSHRNAVPREFGSWRQRATPFMRPAWQQTQGEVLAQVQELLGPEIEKTAARAAKRRAKALARSNPA